jgi:hypothetical protein
MKAAAVLLALVILTSPLVARADCDDPSAPAGVLIYNADHTIMQYCNGTKWVGVPGPGCDCPLGDTLVMGVSGNWECSSGGVCAAGGSSFLGFTDLTGQPTTTLITSNVLQVTRTGGVSIAGDGSPEYRICGDDACSSEIQSWGSTAGTVGAGEFLQLRLTSNASIGITHSTTVSVGSAEDEWSVTTHENPPVEVELIASRMLPNSGDANSVHTWTGLTTSGPHTVLIVGYWEGNNIVSWTWGGASITTLHVVGPQSDRRAAIGIIEGSRSGNIVLTMQIDADAAGLTLLRLENLQSMSALDTAQAGGNATTLTLSGLSAPEGGVRIAGYINGDDVRPITWTGATEVSDFAVNSDNQDHRHSTAYDLGENDSNIVATKSGSSDPSVLLGVSLR